MIDGLWTGTFRNDSNDVSFGIGVLIFRAGKIFGGNATTYLTGAYTLEDDRLEGRLEGTHYAGDRRTPMGLIDAGGFHRLALSGRLKGDTLTLEGTPEGNTMVRVRGLLSRQRGPEIF